MMTRFVCPVFDFQLNRIEQLFDCNANSVTCFQRWLIAGVRLSLLAFSDKRFLTACIISAGRFGLLRNAGTNPCAREMLLL
jgi:hypothetical protein